MRFVFLLFTLLPTVALAADPRNNDQYHVLFDLETHGECEIADGYGAYIQIYSPPGQQQWIRYCENFEGKGLSGRPSHRRARMKLLPFGQNDPSAYRCRDFLPKDTALGQPLIRMGDRSFFAMKTVNWTAKDGGEILFQFAKKVPLIGAPTFRTLRVRALRKSEGNDYTVETILPRAGVHSSHFFDYQVSTSGLGLPNGIVSLMIDPGERTNDSVDLESLEGEVLIYGDGKSSKRP